MLLRFMPRVLFNDSLKWTLNVTAHHKKPCDFHNMGCLVLLNSWTQGLNSANYNVVINNYDGKQGLMPLSNE